MFAMTAFLPCSPVTLSRLAKTCSAQALLVKSDARTFVAAGSIFLCETTRELLRSADSSVKLQPLSRHNGDYRGSEEQ
jgi:hypothetical protein